jgi:hypothetical protein
MLCMREELPIGDAGRESRQERIELYKVEWTVDVSSGKFVDKMLWCSAARAKHSGP